ncbi:unnamed protein product [Urochloa humidicola]
MIFRRARQPLWRQGGAGAPQALRARPPRRRRRRGAPPRRAGPAGEAAGGRAHGARRSLLLRRVRRHEVPPCFDCSGRRKLVVPVPHPRQQGGCRRRTTNVLVHCGECNENGLVLCPICS